MFQQPTRDDRGWLINPLGPNPWWTAIITVIPALLCTILIFMDQQITAVIINRKENKLKVLSYSALSLHVTYTWFKKKNIYIYRLNFCYWVLPPPERLWLPPGLVHGWDNAGCVLFDGIAVVCCSHCPLHHPC